MNDRRVRWCGAAWTVACTALFLLPPTAVAIDWSKCPSDAGRPADAPHGWSHWWGATEYMKEGNCEGAINESQYLINHPEFSSPKYSHKALVLQGQCYELQKQPAKAMAAYVQALKQFGKAEQTLYLLADLYLRQDNPAQAAKLFGATLKMNPKNSDAARGLAASYLALGKVQEARQATDLAERLGADVAALRRGPTSGGKGGTAAAHP
ncbi:MAG: hypothetical protein COW73_11470 [Nitrospirae bacterium CG18_big_fil_WC_8_21_14_2_50_70_55]|nr:tetratricopeptide repeat protein [Deltaproteobacteria bacterium]PIQ03331.1 MAG: hypothetical protein COW73_11470 [Nitrospirae bacterium CG18_big_fil_WC_8_21_14_2_50_70_55]PIU77755.1 MAG: hypothetical protein COS73_09045 [Nitrospirae bacterium CG06_land_8_20_14_3_00_70_43]PIW81852.1 MAG: hypothetical protein COZ96_11835 [Nitrospirae bacterium CG_4_8_14_3_um_filter_70_85]PIX82100.1 MAG: hypothetical protein COZ33_12530 [Nitrospirae bacterium CG_4_10_14_3_um_filter_70_108]PJB95102.1 MAG: hypot